MFMRLHILKQPFVKAFHVEFSIEMFNL